MDRYLSLKRRKFFSKNQKVSMFYFFILMISLIGCASSHTFKAPEPLPGDSANIPQPKGNKINYIKDGFNKTVTYQIVQSFDFSRQLRNLFGKPRQALNVDAFDEVPNSVWFTNRNYYHRMSLEEIARGPDRGTGPDTNGIWIVVSAKSEGVTPGFTIEDPRGNRYPIKFDPKGYSELATGAEVIATKIFYALGYNVPENYITYFFPKMLRLGENVKITDEKGRKRLMTTTDIEELLQKVEHLPDGRIRAHASKYLDGEIIGGFKYTGTRKDDPNDFVPHQYRRELRGLYVSSSWLKHFDTKAGNNLDVYVTENGSSFIKHYLLDFGSTLGSAAHSPQADHKGHENEFDPLVIGGNLVTLGLNVKSWEKLDPIQYSSIGRFDSFDFNPGATKPNYPNPAFENCTNRDGYWGAKLVMSLTDDQLEVIVKQGQYSDPVAEDYMLKILIERRDIAGRYWYSRINPLDKFIISEDQYGDPVLNFTDLGVEGDLWSAEKTNYQYNFWVNGEKILSNIEIGNKTEIPLIELMKKFDQSNLKKNSPSLNQWEIELRTKRNPDDKWSKGVKLFIEPSDQNGSYVLLGLIREE